MTDRDRTDEEGKPLGEGAELDLSDLTEQSDAGDAQSLLDEAALEGGAPTGEVDSLTEPDMGALVGEGRDEHEAPDLDLSSYDAPDDMTQDETGDEAGTEASDSEPQAAASGLFSDPADEIATESAAAGDAPSDEPKQQEESDYGADTSWLDDVVRAREEAVANSPEDDGEDDDFGGDGEGPEAPEKSGSKLPLLLVLLAVAAGAAFYFSGSKPEQPSKPVPAHQSVPTPDTSAPQAAGQSGPDTSMEAMSTPESGTTAGSDQQTVSVDQDEQKMAVITPKTLENTAPAAGSAEQTRPQQPEAREAAAPEAPKPAVAATPKAASTQQGGYTLQGGVFVFRSSLKQAQKKVQKLGFEPRVSVEKKRLPMIRLRVGRFPAEVALAKLKQVQKLAPHGAFALKKGDQVTIYAGSYYFAKAAHRATKRLKAKGLPVQEETAKVRVPVHVLHFGSFGDRKAAEAKLAEVKAAGMNAFVEKQSAAKKGSTK